jgi:hypothetical protein
LQHHHLKGAEKLTRSVGVVMAIFYVKLGSGFGLDLWSRVVTYARGYRMWSSLRVVVCRCCSESVACFADLCHKYGTYDGVYILGSNGCICVG